jgi:hypothetical protein
VDYSLPVRQAVIVAMVASPVITALIPAGSIYPGVVPTGRTFPFSRYGSPQTTPFRLSGLNSSSTRFALHGFTGPGKQGQTVVETAEDRAWRIAAAFKAVLDDAALPIAGGMHATLTWLDTTCLIDRDEQDAWHAVVNFTAEAAG